jgi:hypothetical protein
VYNVEVHNLHDFELIVADQIGWHAFGAPIGVRGVFGSTLVALAWSARVWRAGL